MKALVAAKEFDGKEVGSIVQFAIETPNNYLINEGILVSLDVPENVNILYAKTEMTNFPERWVKGSTTVFEIPLITTVVGYEEDLTPITETVFDESYTHYAAYIEMTIVEDSLKKDAYIKSQGVQKYVKRIEYSKTILGTMAYLNESKVLDVPQIIQLNTTYAPIKGLLETGSFGSAYTMIQQIVPDDVISQSDIIAISELISTYLSNEV